MNRRPLFENMSLATRIKWARENHPRAYRRKDVADWFNLKEKTYEAVERGKSNRRAVEMVPELADKLGIPEAFFWDKKPVDPYVVDLGDSEYDEGDYVDVDLHVPYISGMVSISMNQTKKAKLPAGHARNTFGIQVVDDDNIPRLKRGMIVFFEPRSTYNDGDLVAFDHPTEKVKGPDGKSHPRTLMRRYVLDDSTWRLKPQNPGAESFLAQGIRILGAAKIIRKIHADGWYSDEVNLTQIPYHPPT